MERKPETVVTTVRLPAELVARLDQLAAREHRSRNQQVAHLLEKALSETK
jgi:predicted transcriptional regulator